MPKKSSPKPDNRARFGWTNSLDDAPQVIHKFRNDTYLIGKQSFAVAVIKLPFMSAKMRSKVNKFAKDIIGADTFKEKQQQIFSGRIACRK
jgi:hypothetical protein